MTSRSAPCRRWTRASPCWSPPPRAPARRSWQSTRWNARWAPPARAFYTTPLKALSNQKLGYVTARYGADRVGLLIAVANASSYGGGMLVCPEARLDDGKLDVCVIGEIPKWDFVRTFPKVFKGRHIDHPKVHMLRGQQIEVSAERPFQVFADGELVGRSRQRSRSWRGRFRS
jgi:diacylglycerol kinase family enzyme